MDLENASCNKGGNSDSESDGDLDLEIEFNNSQCSEDDEYFFEVFSSKQVVDDMMKIIQQVSSVLKTSKTTTRLLLNYHKWDSEKLLEKFFDSDQEKLFAEAHIPFKKGTTIIKRNNVVKECGVCFTGLQECEMTGLQDCGHLFCQDCWMQYLKVQVMDEGQAEIHCIEPQCNFWVDDAMILHLVKDSQVKLKYQHLIINIFVRCNRLLKWCPAPGCDYVIKVMDVEAKLVTCKCRHNFCFYCEENWHEPVKCDLLKNWIKRCSDDTETYSWIAKNTKECPNCHMSIEKNGGCNHMTCKNSSCRYEFCWLCLGNWARHHHCNVYNEHVNQSSIARAQLERYIFYHKRYMDHMKSLKLENNLYVSIDRKMEEMRLLDMTWNQVLFLRQAVDILCSCRQTLMYTYVFAYNVKKNNQTEIFEVNQKDLEIATEVLSGYLERDIDTEELVNIKQKVKNKYEYCYSRMKVLLEHVNEGYQENWWDFIQ